MPRHSVADAVVLEHLRKNAGRKYNVKELHTEMTKKYHDFNVHYLTVRNAIKRLKESEENIHTEEYRVMVLVWYEREKT